MAGGRHVRPAAESVDDAPWAAESCAEPPLHGPVGREPGRRLATGRERPAARRAGAAENVEAPDRDRAALAGSDPDGGVVAARQHLSDSSAAFARGHAVA